MRLGSSTSRRAARRGRLWSVVLAAGQGCRLRDTVRGLLGATLPKQFCRLGGAGTLLQESVDRLASRVPGARTVVVVSREHRAVAREQLAGRACRIVSQPADRGTAAGLALALPPILRRDPDAIVVVQPSDTGIADDAAFLEGIDTAVRAGGIVLLGVGSAGPSTDYGWILCGGVGGPLRSVDGFVEKPSYEVAARLHREGHLWNTMVLVARARDLFDLIADVVPGVALPIADAWRDARPAQALRAAYDTLPRADFSRDVLQRAAGLRAYAWPARLGWSDLGTPDRLLSWLRGRGPGELARRLEDLLGGIPGVASGLRTMSG